MKKNRGILITLKIMLFVFSILFSPFVVGAVGDGVDIDLNVLGCNNNGVCEAVLTEDFLTCSSDCYCDNDGICEAQTGEDFLSCSSDCYCDNDGICDADNGETLGNCPNDCSTPEPPDPDDDNDGGTTPSGYRQLLIYNIETEVDLENQKVYISWETNVSALAVLYWGHDQDYKTETLSSINFTQEHFTSIDNVPFGEYFFIIKARSFYGATAFSEIGTFILSRDDIDLPPDNPTNFRTYATGQKGIGLAWNNPLNIDFNRVRIVRETRGFPSTYLDGKIVYEGGSQSVVDSEVEEGQTYYYSIFAIDDAGQPSTGVAMKVKYPLGDIYDQRGDIFDDDSGIKDDDSVDDQVLDPNYFPIERYKFLQKGQEIPINKGILVIDGEEVLEILVDQKYIDPKSEVVAYFDTNQTRNYSGYKFAYFPKEGVYKAQVPPFKIDDEIPFMIIIYSRTGEELRKTSGILASFLPKISPLDFGRNYDEVIPSLIFWVILSLFIFYGLIWRKKRSKNKS